MYKKNGKWAYWKVQPEDIQSIITMYHLEKMSAKKIGDKFNCGELSIFKVLRDYNVPIRTENKSRKFSRGYVVNEDSFSDMGEPTAAYLYGWLLTDGYITRKNSVVGIEVGKQDASVIKLLKDYIGTNTEIFERTREDSRTNTISQTVGFKFSHEPVINRLVDLGLEPNKSLKETVHSSLENNRHFWRGVLEGDGHVSSKYTKVFVCGGLELCEKWVEFVKTIDPIIRSRVYSHKAPMYYASTTDRNSAKLILDCLYEGVDESLRLERKYNAYLERYYGNID